MRLFQEDKNVKIKSRIKNAQHIKPVQRKPLLNVFKNVTSNIKFFSKIQTFKNV